MRIKSIRIKNFRAFADETISLDRYSCLVGANGAGKSTVLCALNVFFRETTNATDVQALSAEDFHRKNTVDRIEITLTFHELSELAAADLKDYVRNGELIVTAIAEFDAATERAKVRQVGSRMGMLDFAPFFKAYGDKATAGALDPLFLALREKHPGIASARSREDRADALRQFEAAHPELAIPLESEDAFYGIAGGSRLKAHIQWVYIPAVKDASDEQSESRDSALGKLLARTVRAKVNFKDDVAALEAETLTRYRELIDQRQGALDEVGISLTQRLAAWCHPDAEIKLAWTNTAIPIKEPTARAIAGESGFLGDLARFGHGFQRSYLIALLQELSSTDDANGPTLILGCEEPELYQHPPQARYLSQVLQHLSNQNAQVIVTTHSPYFVGGASFESIRMVRRDPGTTSACARSVSYDDFAASFAHADEQRPLRPNAIAAQINEVLRPQINEMFFSRRVVLVEGSEDAAHIMAWMALTDRITEFRSRGIHVVPVDGKSHLARPLIVAQRLNIPVFVVFDADYDQRNDPRHQADNRRLLRLLGTDQAQLFPNQTVWHPAYTQWSHDIAHDVDAELLASLGTHQFEQVKEQARTFCGQAPNLHKNTVFIQHKLMMALECAGACQTLDRLCAAILG